MPAKHVWPDELKVDFTELEALKESAGTDYKSIQFIEILRCFIYFSRKNTDKKLKLIENRKIFNNFASYFNSARGAKFKFFVIAAFLGLPKIYIPCYKLVRGINKYYRLFIGPKKYYCPCCGNHIRNFMEFDFVKPDFNPNIYMNHYKSVICPQCGSLPRHRILSYFILNNLELFNKKQVLGFGLGGAEKKILSNSGIKYFTSDIKSGCDFLYDIQDINCESEKWDIAICNHVLEHVEDYQKAISELYRILKHGGFVIISAPTRHSYADTFDKFKADTELEKVVYYGQIDHLRVFGDNFPTYLKNAGFDVEKIDGNNMPANICPKVGPADYDDNVLYLCRKK